LKEIKIPPPEEVACYFGPGR